MKKTKIEWCDYTWSPITGCTHGCSYCYARKMAIRIFNMQYGLYVSGKRKEKPCEKCGAFIPHFHPERLDGPGEVKKPGRVFVCSMGDFWGSEVKREWRERVLFQITLQDEYMREDENHQFLILTKQPQNIDMPKHYAIPELWQGVSVTGPGDLWRIEELVKRVPARRFVSFEPLLGDFDPWDIDIERLDWVIVGAQTKPLILPNTDHVNQIVNACIPNKVPVFLKNNLGHPKIQQYPAGLML